MQLRRLVSAGRSLRFNGNAFRTWVQQILVPVLEPGDVIVIDNLSAHKIAGIVEAIEGAGAQVRYLLPYSPDFNPIKQVFAKFKTLFRKTAARTMDSLCSAFGSLLDQFDTAGCERHICHCGCG
jgi:transposase